MGDHFFVLSGEHSTLPRSEVLALLEAYGIQYTDINDFKQVLSLSASIGDPRIFERLGMCHMVCELLETASSPTELRGGHDLSPSFAIRVKRIERAFRDIDVDEIINGLAATINGKVDLESPENELLVVLTDRILAGRVLVRVERGGFEARKPHKRPFFYPGSLSPRLARSLVNLGRLKLGGCLLDPFCGTGGILIEAGLMGIRTVGLDMDPRMVEGARQNLSYYGVESGIRLGDATKSLPDGVDAIVTDLPYGRSVRQSNSFEDMCKDFMELAEDVISQNGYLVMVSHKETDLGTSKLRLVETHLERVHKSLTRRIYVFRRE